MISVVSFTFNPFQENTFVVYDETKECIIFDPGCYTIEEKEELVHYIETEGLTPVQLINTHCHVDHVLGNKFVAEKYNLALATHKGEIPVLEAVPSYAKMMGFNVEVSPLPTIFLDEGDTVTFGNSSFEVIFTPGHSPASISFVNKAQKIVIGGDVLFQNSIGRTDLPGGDFNTLIHNIKTKLLVLPDDTRVYCGHGPSTLIGYEKKYNQFLQ